MQVISTGKPNFRWAHQFICTGHGNGGVGCGARLLVDQHDLFKTTSQALDETFEHITFRCCECDTLTDIDASEVPAAVAATLKIRNP